MDSQLRRNAESSEVPAAPGDGWTALRQDDHRLRQLLDRNQAGVYRIAWDGTILECNAAFARLFGRTPRELIGQPIQPFYADPGQRHRLLGDLERDNAFTAREIGFIRTDGSPVWILSTAARVPCDNGTIEIEGTFIDITPLRRASAALIASEARFRSLVETTGSAIVCADRDQRITTFNPAAERIFGVACAEAMGRPYASLFPAGVRVKVAGDLRRIMTGATIDGFENVVARPDGAETVVLWNIRPLLDADGRPDGIVAVGQDITARQRAKEALVRQAHYLSALTAIDRAILALQRPDAIAGAVLRHIDTLLRCRGAAVVTFDGPFQGPRVAASCGDPAWSGGSRALSAEELGQGTRVLPGPRPDTRVLQVPLLVQGKAVGCLHVHQETDRDHAVSASEMEMAGHIADRLAVAFHNWHLFEAANHARQRIESMSTRLVEAQEAERRQVARELHDEIGQGLTGLILQLESMGRRDDPAGRERAVSIVRQLISQVRDLSLQLRPAVLDDFGLHAALMWHVERYGRSTGLRVHYDQAGLDRRLPSRLETAVYRIVQEGLTNVARHASVGEARVFVQVTAGDVRVEVEDLGAGFDPSCVQPHQSMGLSGMRERTTLLGGTLAVISSPGGGTLIRASIPLPAD